ncbi:MAG TPA: choice-of-anchor tandem repeat NxxGxxAF-containing protein [Tepidisphaeraceae bacterium]|nr:choice-of-anchor tandem repeat NxxGxxAF-containing protein [Tepidisphaeraceae bacterium]
MGKRVWRKCAVAAVAVGIVAPALRADQVDTIALTGQAAPGPTGGMFGSIGAPMIDAAGALAFRAGISGATDGSMQGVFLLDGAGTSINFARLLQSAPGSGGGTFSSLSSPILSGNSVAFNGQFTGSNDGSSMGLFQATGSGTVGAVVRDQQAAPGAGGGIFGTALLNQPPGVNAAGQVVFYDNFTASTDGSSFGVFRGAGGGPLVAIMRDKLSAPGGGSFTSGNFAAPQINASGLVADVFGLSGSSDGATQEVFRGDGTTNIAIARQNQSAPGAGGGTFNAFSGPLINDLGSVAFAASLSATTDGSAAGIFAGSGATPSAIARDKQSAPGAGGGAFTSALDPLAINFNGQVLFSAGLGGTSDGSTAGLFRGNGVSTAAIAREKQSAPGGGAFTSSLLTPGMNSLGDVVFSAGLSGSPDGAGQGIFVSDGQDVVPVVRGGQPLAGSTVVSMSLAGFAASPGPAPASINDQGQVAFAATLANGATGVFRYTPDLHYEPNGGSWSQTHAWTLGLTPASVHNVLIQPTGNATVTGPTGNTTVKSLTVGNSGAGTGDLVLASNITLTGASAVTVQGQGQIDLQAGTLSTPVLNVAGNFNLSGGTLSAATVNQTAGSFLGSNVAIGGTNSIGTYNLLGGTLTSASSLSLNPGGTFNGAGGTISTPNFLQNGGTVTGTLVNTTTFTYSSGSFSGRLINRGTLAGASLTAGNGVENDASLSLGSNTLTANGAGLDNLGPLNLSGGTLAGSGPALNDFGATLSGAGTISVALTNEGLLQPIGVLTLSAPGSSSGQVNLGSQATLSQSAGFSNTGHIELTGGAIVGAGQLTNNAGGLIHGNLPFAGAPPTLSSISSPLSNSGGIIRVENNATLQLANLMNNSTGGQIVVQDGGSLSVASGFANSSVITLNGPSATLAAGTIGNTGSLLGIGTVSAAVANSGIIRPGAGQLTLSAAANTNLAGGQIEAPAGSTVLFAQGLATNTGTIALNGGTFDNNHQPVLNTGSILGNGVFGSGGLTNAAGGQINVADVGTQFLGAVSNSGSIQITNNTTTFFDPFTNNAGGTLKTTAATVRFLSSFTNNGIFSSDPADNYFTDLTILATGVLEGGAGDRFFISGDFLNSSAERNAWNTAQALVDLQGAAAHVLGVAGRDLGANGAGYSDNFAIGTLVVDHGGAIVLHGPADSALYVGTLALADGLSQIASIQGDGLKIYYDPGQPGNVYLSDGTYALAGGGTLAPVPEPWGVAATVAAALILRRRRRGLPAGRPVWLNTSHA